MWELDNIKYFFLLLLIPLLGLLLIANNLWKRKKQKEFGSAKALSVLAPDLSKNKSIAKSIIYLFALVLIIIALVNPKIGTRIETVKRQGIDIVFAVDVSKSMLAKDMLPNRLEKSKQLITQIINNLGSDRIGIVGYAGSAFPMLPITTDYGVAKMFLHNMDTDMVSSVGTDFEDAIQIASNFFDDPQTSKLIIMISDGEDHGEGLQKALEIAKAKQIRIITIGVGTENGAPIPMQKGKTIEYKRDWNDNVVITKLVQETLKTISRETGGRYYYGSNTQEIVSLIKEDLNKIEKSEFDSQQITEYQSQYQWFLGLALLLLLIDLFVLERKTKRLKELNIFK